MKKNYDELIPDDRKELYNETILKQSQYVMLRILRIVVDVFEENNIEYWLTGGTLLGAVRHKGFIPWDDDIDICISQSQYEEAIRVLNENLPKDLFIQTLETDKYYDLPWIKIKDNNSYIKEYKPGKYHKGIFIDIFPMMEVIDDKNKINHERNKLKILHRIISSVKEPFDKMKSIKMVIKNIFKLCVKIVFFPLTIMGPERCNRLLRNASDKVMKKIEKPGSGHLETYPGVVFYDDPVEDSMIMPLSKISFEGYEFYAPEKYDEYLTYYFGDYMKLPDEKDRIPHYLEITPDIRCDKSKLDI